MAIGAAATEPAAQPEPDLFERLSAYCGQAFEGRVISDDPRDEAFATERLVMHVRTCGVEKAAAGCWFIMHRQQLITTLYFHLLLHFYEL